MRFFVIPALVLACSASFAKAQPEKKFQPPKIEKYRVGFQVASGDLFEPTAYKAGLWTPVYVEVFGGSDGIKADPAKKDRPHIQIETEDNDSVGTSIGVPVDVEPEKTRLFIGYVKTAHASHNSQEIKITLHVNNRQISNRDLPASGSLGNDSQLYLTLGSRLKDFHKAVVDMNPGKDGNFNQQFTFDNIRLAAFETDLARLPNVWFGYNGVDLMILSTENQSFLTGLANDKEKLKAIAQWVRRGGRLVVPIARRNQQFVAALLQDEIAWQPAIPVVPPRAEAGLQYDRLAAVAAWGGAHQFPFVRKEKDPKNPLVSLPIPVATLDPGNVHPGDWEVLADSGQDNRPLIARVRYGLGQITYLAFSLEDPAFFNWEGKYDFLKSLVLKSAPPRPNVANPPQRFGMNQEISNDLASEILNLLDNFDVKVIPFGYVALFIILYILVVGPLDFFLLKYVFKRLEWTWITFPSVVLAVSVIAYFAAYALKGRDMKINKIDIVDFDLRTSLDAARKPQNVHVYGHSFFTILSPRIQNYTIGLEPNPAFWGEKPGKTLNVDLLSWLGRPSGGMNNMGRPGGSSGSFLRRPYDYTEDATGLRGVPIPVWTTKAFSASWEETLPKPPFVVDLAYYQKGDKIAGQLENHLGVDLVDAWLIYDERFYPLEGGLKSVPLGATPEPVSLVVQNAKELAAWVNLGGAKDDAPEMRLNPTNTIKRLLFHEKFDTQITGHNHLLRPLDLGWRVKKEELGVRGRTREAILFASVKSASDAAESIQRDPKSPPPTKLWLGELPDAGATGRERPALNGNMNQCTYIRVILPLKSAEE